MEELGSRETAIFSVKTDKPDKLILLFALNREQAAALFLKLLQDCVVEPVRFLGGEGAREELHHTRILVHPPKRFLVPFLPNTQDQAFPLSSRSSPFPLCRSEILQKGTRVQAGKDGRKQKSLVTVTKRRFP